MPKILLAGDDVSLLGTRAAVLAKMGAEVITCTGSQTLSQVKTERPDLVVLCHSLLPCEAESIADKIRKCCKTAKVLMVLSGVGVELPIRGKIFDAMSSSNPELLLACVSELLSATLPPRVQPMKSDGKAIPIPESGGDYRM